MSDRPEPPCSVCTRKDSPPDDPVCATCHPPEFCHFVEADTPRKCEHCGREITDGRPDQVAGEYCAECYNKSNDVCEDRRIAGKVRMMPDAVDSVQGGVGVYQFMRRSGRENAALTGGEAVPSNGVVGT